MDCQEARISLGVYVLGAIDPADRALVDAHLATCRDCRDELAGLASLPALLARVAREEAIALAADEAMPAGLTVAPEPPRELLSTVLDLTAARRRRRRWRDAGIGVAAAAVVAAGVFGGLQLGNSPSQPPTSLSVGAVGSWVTRTGHNGAMAATVSYRSAGWGTELKVLVNGIAVGTRCQLYVIDKSGQRTEAGGWQTDNAEGTVYYPGSAGLPSRNVGKFVITVGTGKTITVSA
jgi:predicted anti-sigma-YlaC factor YlaD